MSRLKRAALLALFGADVGLYTVGMWWGMWRRDVPAAVLFGIGLAVSLALLLSQVAGELSWPDVD